MSPLGLDAVEACQGLDGVAMPDHGDADEAGRSTGVRAFRWVLLERIGYFCVITKAFKAMATGAEVTLRAMLNRK